MGLLIPEVAAIGSSHALSVVGGIRPGPDPLDGSGLVDNPLPRNDATLTRFPQQTIDTLHFRPRHRRDQALREQLVSDTTAGDRFRVPGSESHRIDQFDGSLRHAATLFGTCFKIPGHSTPCSALAILLCAISAQSWSLVGVGCGAMVHLGY
jgi:hypothetical protein